MQIFGIVDVIVKYATVLSDDIRKVSTGISFI
jgi:hypothetical protein